MDNGGKYLALVRAVANLIYLQASHHLISSITYKKKSYIKYSYTIPNANDSTNKVLSVLRCLLQLIIHKVFSINCEKAFPFE